MSPEGRCLVSPFGCSLITTQHLLSKHLFVLLYEKHSGLISVTQMNINDFYQLSSVRESSEKGYSKTDVQKFGIKLSRVAVKMKCGCCFFL